MRRYSPHPRLDIMLQPVVDMAFRSERPPDSSFSASILGSSGLTAEASSSFSEADCSSDIQRVRVVQPAGTSKCAVELTSGALDEHNGVRIFGNTTDRTAIVERTAPMYSLVFTC